MKNLKLLIIISILSMNTVFAQKTSLDKVGLNKEMSSLELPNIKVIPIKDTKTEKNYELYIKLPEDYSDSNNVVYLIRKREGRTYR